MKKTGKTNINQVERLLSELDRNQIDDFIRRECKADSRFLDRFLALGAGTVFMPSPDAYSARIYDLIDDFSGRYGYIEYRDSFQFNLAFSEIYDEFDEAMKKKRWRVALTILMGISACNEDIINSGDDSSGDLGAIVSECFAKWQEMASRDDLPDDIHKEIFELALERFKNKDLKNWDWWWSWIEIAISLADDPNRQKLVIEALEAIKPQGDDWIEKHNAQTAQEYLLRIMAKKGTPAEQRKFMYDNVSNSEFRTKLLEMSWDEKDYDEVLRLAKDGVEQDSKWDGLMTDWREWEFRAYRQKGDNANVLRLARHFFFRGFRFGEKEFSMESMYSLMKSLVEKDKWNGYVESLLTDKGCRSCQLLYIYVQEKMWNRYMDYIRKNPEMYVIDDAPKEVLDQYKDEIIVLYAECIRRLFVVASSRDRYRDGVQLLKKLMAYGGEKEARAIIEEQKSRRPRRPALIEELSKI